MWAGRQDQRHGDYVSLPLTSADQQFARTITDDSFLLTDLITGEIVFSLSLPIVALRMRVRLIASYAIRGVENADPSKQ